MNKTTRVNRMETSQLPQSYFQHFQVAQVNLVKHIQEERLLRRLNRSKDKHS